MSLSAEYNRHGFLSRSCPRHRAATTLLCKRDNDNDAGFPRSDGRLSHLYLCPFFVIQTGTFWVRPSTFVLTNIGFDERRKMAATLIPSAVVGNLLLGPSASFDCFRGVLAQTQTNFPTTICISPGKDGCTRVFQRDTFLTKFCHSPRVRWRLVIHLSPTKRVLRGKSRNFFASET